MSDSTPIAAAPEATTLLDLPTVFTAVCEPSRHALLRWHEKGHVKIAPP